MQNYSEINAEVNEKIINIIHSSFKKLKLIIRADMNLNPINKIESRLCYFYENYDTEIEKIYGCEQNNYGINSQDDVIVRIISRNLIANINNEIKFFLENNNYSIEKQKIYLTIYNERETTLSLLLNTKNVYDCFMNDEIVKVYKYNEMSLY